MKNQAIIATVLLVFSFQIVQAQRGNRGANQNNRVERHQKKQVNQQVPRTVNRQVPRRVTQRSNNRVYRQPNRRVVVQPNRRVIVQPNRRVVVRPNRRVYRRTGPVIIINRFPRVYYGNRSAQNRLFNQYDYNNDGYLSFYEFDDFSFDGRRLRDSSIFFNDFDYNYDNYISRREFLDALQNQRYY